ncbi:MAG: TonB-dependent receptor [Flavobacteriaceae bacterium]|nr:MAG: TonB-dependent receptor [Flavobacteriaceae bacterium]
MKYASLCIMYCCVQLSVSAQNTPPVSLSDALEKIEKEFSVSFSYADENIKNIQFSFPQKKVSLDELLVILASQTKLLFKKLSPKIIAISVDGPFSGVINLDMVLIKNYLTKGIHQKVNGSIEIKPMSAGILPGLTEPDIFHTLQALPGIYSVEERISNINIRGGTHGQNLILWNRIKVYQVGHFFGLISAFNPYVTDKIYVYKNGTNAYHGGGVSGVIDMQSDLSKVKKASVNLGLNALHTDITTTFPVAKKTNLQLSLRRSFTDFFKSPTYKEYLQYIIVDSDLKNEVTMNNDKFVFVDSNIGIHHTFSENSSLKFNAFHLYNKLDYETIFNGAATRGSQLKQESLGSALHYKKRIDNTTINGQIYLSQYHLTANDNRFITANRLHQNNQVLDIGFRTGSTVKLNEKLELTSGYQYKKLVISDLEIVTNPTFGRKVTQELITHAVFGTIAYYEPNNLYFRFGIRAIYHRKFSKSIAEPRMSVSKKIGPFVKLNMMGEFKSQTISQITDLQNAFFGIEKRRWVLSNNADIPITKSKQLSFGVHYKKNDLMIGVNAFVKEVNGISSRSQGFQNQLQFVNATGSYTINGIDFLLHKKINHFVSWINYTYSNNVNHFNINTQQQKFPSNFDIRHNISISNTYTFNKIKLAAKLNWHTGRPFTGINENTPILNNEINYAAINSNNLKNYFRVDFSATKEFKTKRFRTTMGISLWNLLNTNNTINTYFIKINDTTLRSDVSSLGFTANIFFRVVL